MPPRSAAAKVALEIPAMSNGCPQVEAMDRQTAAISLLADEVRAAREALTPAAEAVSDLGAAQKKFCNFIVGNRLKLAASVPLVLTLVGGAAPNLAHGIAELLKVWGVQ